MRWYEGEIADAVVASKKKNAIFVVYIHGTDPKSKQITSIIEEEGVSSKLGGESFVAIQIAAGSVPHQQFAQIYKLASVPSLFFIGKSGVPLEIVTDVENAEELITKIDGLLKNNQTGATNKAKESDGFIKAEQSSSSATQQNTNVVCDNGVCTLKNEQPSTSQEKELTAEEKVERAKSLIDKTKELKEKEDHEKEKTKELERRKVGQEVQKLKRWQEDQELKQLKEERDREKREQQAARDRVLAQIAQDKADRAARFASTSPPQQQQPQQQASPQPVRRSPTNGNRARLQFKLADGSSHTHDFSSSDTLETVRNYVTGNINLPYGDFLLSTTFPRREFNSADNSQTLADLSLVPNAVILILPVAHGAVSTNTGGGLTAILWSLLTPILSIFNYIRNYFTGQKKPQNQTSPVKRPAEGNPETTSRAIPKRRAAESTVVRRQGNIHRLSDKTDSDDENNTWNGNSTQQM